VSIAGATFTVRAPAAESVWLCLFDDAETRHAMTRIGENWTATVEGITPGQRYGYRAAGPGPHDETKLLVDPYATMLDRRFAWHPDLAIPGAETAPLVPKAIVTAPHDPVPTAQPYFREGGLIYELNVRGFTMLHPDVPAEQRGTIAALAHPAIVAHLQKLRVTAVELMPIVAWIDERHLAPLGLTNAWGYNPVVPMALDSGLCPGGVLELRETIDALHAAGIGVILDLVFNHSGESDLDGPMLSFRGLDDAVYARNADGNLINDTGTGNTFDFANPAVRGLTLATLRHFAQQGVDGFRFDLAPVIARGPGFDPAAPIFAAIAADPLLSTRVMIAEPWDIGPGGYQLGNFPTNWLEWNDRFRDDVRRFWRGDGDAGTLATRLSGSPDIFGQDRTRTVNFIAAHDGFTLADVVSHRGRHNHANGEDNRDGHADEIAWNNGAEGPSHDPAIAAARAADSRALLATLFASRGTIMLAAGDEFGRTQRGNNNAYAQDNPTTWLDWERRDVALEDYVAGLADYRAAHPELSDPAIRHDVTWQGVGGSAMQDADWAASDGFRLNLSRATVAIDRAMHRVTFDGD
jgi:glycogen debranching enzyme